jgi:alkyl hydroperoxide reductase subunit AhpC
MAGNVLQVGQPAPLFRTAALEGESFKVISLDQYRGKYVVVLFYPADSFLVCPTEITSFSDRIDEFKMINCEVLGVLGVEHISCLKISNALGSLSYPFLDNSSHDIGIKYGVHSDDGLSLRGLFIIDDEGVLRHMVVCDLPGGWSVDETKRLVQKFQELNRKKRLFERGY